MVPAGVRRGVSEIFVDSSLDISIARRHAIAAASSRCLIRAGDGRYTRVGPTQRPKCPGERPARRRPGPVLHGGGAGRGARDDGSGHGRGIGVSTDRAAKAR